MIFANLVILKKAGKSTVVYMVEVNNIGVIKGKMCLGLKKDRTCKAPVFQVGDSSVLEEKSS